MQLFGGAEIKLPSVSIVIPARNAEPWLGLTLDSVYSQTYPHQQCEIIFVDDGSTDGTLALARRLLAQGDIPHAILTTPKAGPSAARNMAWRAASGEWIQFLDADDILESEKLEFQARSAEKTTADTAAFFSEWGRLYLGDNVWTPHPAWVSPYLNADPLMDLLRPDNFIPLGSQLVRREWLARAGGFVEAYSLIEDVDLELRLIMQGAKLRMVNAGRPLFWYRQRALSLSRADPIAFVNGCVRNARMAESYWREHAELTAERAAFLTDAYFGAARALAQDAPQDFEQVLGYLYGVNPHFVPPAPTTLKWLARSFGYRRAERIAVQFRQLKRLVKNERPPNEVMP